MDLSLYNIIVAPVISDKAYRVNSVHKQLVLRVHMKANKPLISEALNKLFKVEVDTIRVVIRKGKAKRSGRHMTRGVHKKIAYVTLKEGYSLDFIPTSHVPVKPPTVQAEASVE